jgi:pimeloyl-ACP methyl ester carboxylesterase
MTIITATFHGMTNWTSGVVRANGVDLHYVRTGGSKPPLILLHGLTGNGACWTPLARALEDRFDVIMPDARGHGKSSAPLHGYRYEDHAADVIALIEKLGLIAPAVLGHSMGGMTTAVVASQIADRVSGVILVDPTFISPQWQREVRDSDVAEQHRRTLSLDRATVLADLTARHPHRSPEVLELLAEARLQTRMSAFDVLTPPNPGYRQLVRDINVPITLIIADAGVVSLDTARELQTINRRVRIEEIEGAGHGIPFDQPERFAAVVRHASVCPPTILGSNTATVEGSKLRVEPEV